MAMKHTKQEANYRNKGTVTKKCSKCAYFIEPDACDVVKGEISPQGVSKYFKSKMDFTSGFGG